MRIYEIIVIFKEEFLLNIKIYVSIIKKLIIYNNCFLIRMENLGLLKFSYKIKNFYKGYYISFNVKLDFDTFNKIKYYLKYNKNVLRFLAIKVLKKEYNINYFVKKKLKLKLLKSLKFNCKNG